ncbi:MAG: hypothetical protein RBT78_12970 [Kiritimatiellia bacterium]|jgi:hypothetical protein|nr:hypothetical protein [Kiritimatiellia bacterium]
MTEAKLNREYALRILGVGALMTGLSVWSLYDGFAAWPRQNRALDAARPALLARELSAEAWLDRDAGGTRLVDAVFAAQGRRAPSKLVKKLGELRVPASASGREGLRAMQAAQIRRLFEGPVYDTRDLQSQSVQAAVTLGLALLAFFTVARKARLRFAADDSGLSGSGFGNASVPYAELARIDWSKWDAKGIVVLTLRNGRRHKLDGWHFAGMTGLADEIRRHRPDLSPDAG